MQANINKVIDCFKRAIRDGLDEVSMFNLAHICIYGEAGECNLDMAIRLLIKPLSKRVPYSVELLCVSVIKKQELLTQSDSDSIAEKCDIRRESFVPQIVYEKIENDNLCEKTVYRQLYDKLKKVNAFYKGTIIEFVFQE